MIIDNEIIRFIYKESIKLRKGVKLCSVLNRILNIIFEDILFEKINSDDKEKLVNSINDWIKKENVNDIKITTDDKVFKKEWYEDDYDGKIKQTILEGTMLVKIFSLNEDNIYVKVFINNKGLFISKGQQNKDYKIYIVKR